MLSALAALRSFLLRSLRFEDREVNDLVSAVIYLSRVFRPQGSIDNAASNDSAAVDSLLGAASEVSGV